MADRRADESPDVFARSFPATLEDVDRCCSQATAFLAARASAFEEPRFGLELLLREALTNAVVHGSRPEAPGTVVLRLTTDAVGVTIEVSDEGAGFNWRDALVRPLDPSREGGRGVAIYRQFADSVSFNEAGNAVTLTRHWRKGDGRA